MRICVLTFLLLFCVTDLFAQNYEIAWTRTIDNGNNDKAFSLVVDGDGHVHVAGYTVIGSYSDMFTVVYDSAGNLLEADTVDNGDNDYALGIAMDSAGNFYITGKSYIGSNYDYFTYKTSNGVIVWVDTIDKGYDDEAWDVTVDRNGNFYVTGNVYSTITSWDRFTVKYSPSGDTIWTRRSNISTDDLGRAVAVDSKGNVYVGGSGNFNSLHSWYLTKYDSSGNFLWADTFSLDLINEFIYDLAVDRWDNVYATGTAGDCFYTVKWDTAGNIVWERSGGLGSGYGITVDTLGNVYVTGNLLVGSNYDIVTIKYDSSGSVVWADTISHVGYDGGNGIGLDDKGNIYVAGYQYNYVGSNNDFVTIKYENTTGVHSRNDIEEPVLKVSLFNEGGIPFSVSLRDGERFRVSLYSVDGRLLESIEGYGSCGYERGFCASSGIYFLLLETGERRVSKKVIVVE